MPIPLTPEAAEFARSVERQMLDYYAQNRRRERHVRDHSVDRSHRGIRSARGHSHDRFCNAQDNSRRCAQEELRNRGGLRRLEEQFREIRLQNAGYPQMRNEQGAPRNRNIRSGSVPTQTRNEQRASQNRNFRSGITPSLEADLLAQDPAFLAQMRRDAQMRETQRSRQSRRNPAREEENQQQSTNGEGEAEGEVGECLICMDPLNRASRRNKLLPCGHCFHQECIDKWLTSKDVFGESVKTCPTCRRRVVR